MRGVSPVLLVLLLALLPAPAVHAEDIEFIGAESFAENTPQLTVDRPAGVAEGDFLLAQMSFRGTDARGYEAPDGWEEFAVRENFTSGNDGMNQALFYRFVTADEPASYNWEIDADDPDDDHFAVIIAGYRNVDPDDPVINVGALSGNDTRDPVAPSINVDGTATGDRVAEGQQGAEFEYVAHLAALRSAAGSDPLLVASWSRAHQSDLIPADPEMITRASDDDGSGRNGIRAVLADQVFSIEDGHIPEGLVLEYRMDEHEWNGTPGEVEDSSGNDHDGTAFGAATRFPDPPRAGSPGTCGYGVFDGEASLEAPAAAAIDDAESITVSAWVRLDPDEQNAEPFQTLLAYGGSTRSGDGVFELFRDGATNALNFQVRTQNRTPTATVDAGVFDGAWHHIVAAYDESTREVRIYVDGNHEVASTHNGNRALQSGDEGFTVGALSGGVDGIVGHLDEVRIYDTPADQQLVDQAFAATRPCDFPVSAYTVEHAETGLTCAPVSVTVTAVAYTGDPVEAGGVTVGLFTDTGNGTWSRLLAGDGTFSPGGSGAAEYTFAAGESSAEFSFNYPILPAGEDSETVALIADDGDASGTGDPPLAVALTGFRFINRDNGEEGIPDQISGKPSFENPNGTNLGLQALEATDDDPGVCEAAFPDGTELEVLLAGECDDPVACAGEALQVNGEAVATAGDAPTDETDYTAVALEFGPDATAPLDLNYFDAGATRLHALYEILLDDEAAADEGTPSGGFLHGRSNAFVWRPFGFAAEVSGNPDEAPAPDGSIFAVAGEDFTVTLRAVAWDGDAFDGTQPAADADLSDNPTTLNFGNETDPASATLGSTLVAPVDGEPGTLTGTTFADFIDGEQQREDVAWNEVGYIEVDAALSGGSYLGTDDITGRAQNVGRFIPADFEQEVAEEGEFAHVCNGAFTYLGQAFGYSARPRLTITARNADGITTRNYRDEYARLTANDITRTGPGEDNEAEDRDGNPLAVGADLGVGDLEDNGDGTLTYTFANDAGSGDQFRYDPDSTRAAALRVTPFEADLTVAIDDIRDADDVSAAVLDDVRPGSVVIRFGTLNIDGAVGSELADLALPLRAEYWDGSTWLVHGDDDCTLVELADHVRLTSSGDDENEPGDQSVALDSGQTSLTDTDDPLTLEDGRGEFVFAAPGADHVGWVDLRIDLDAADLEFLGNGSDAEGEFTADPVGRASFGLFGGNPRQIYRDEVLR